MNSEHYLTQKDLDLSDHLAFKVVLIEVLWVFNDCLLDSNGHIQRIYSTDIFKRYIHRIRSRRLNCFLAGLSKDFKLWTHPLDSLAFQHHNALKLEQRWPKGSCF